MPGKPSNPSRGYSFSGFSAASPSAQQPGPMIDQELDWLSASITATLSWANTAIADGGGLKAGIITTDNFASGVIATLQGSATAEAVAAAASATASAASCTASYNAITAAIAGGPVLSFNGRNGAITPQQSDYDAFFINNTELTTALASYVTSASLSATLAGYATTTALASYALKLSPAFTPVDGVNAGGNLTLTGAGSNRNLKINNNAGAFEFTDPANTAALSFVLSTTGMTYNGYTIYHSGNLGNVGGSPGDLVFTAAATAPSGTLKANGAAVSRTTYANLFAAIGTVYGVGDGSTTFNLPDFRGEFVRGFDDGRGVDAGRTMGSAQASQNLAHNHTGTADSAGAHTHTLAGNGSSGSYPSFPYPALAYNGSGGNTATTSSAGAHTHTLTIANSGGTEARPRNLPALICIKY